MCLCCVSICGSFCFNAVFSKTLEIWLITLNSIAFVLLILCLAIIKWSLLPDANLAFFLIMFFINLIYLIFSILLRVWRAKNLIKTLRKNAGVSLAIWGLVLVIINFIACLIEEIVFYIGVYRVNYPCWDYEEEQRYYTPYRRVASYSCAIEGSSYYVEVITVGQELIGYFTFSYMEVALILNMVLFSILRNRIRMELDGPPQPTMHPQGAVVDQFGRAVVVVQPGDVVMMGGNQYQYNPYIQNQQNVPPVRPKDVGSNDFQIQDKFS